MKVAVFFLLLLPVCWAKPFHQKGLFEFMLEDEGSADLPTDSPDPDPPGAVCPFRCQCHLRVVQCSDLGLPPSLTELHLDGNKITKIDSESLSGLANLAKLGLSFNSISAVDNGSLASIPHLKELHLDNNELAKVPGGLAEHKYIQVVYLHNNKIASVGPSDFCPPGYNTKKASYSGVSLFSNPVQYWEIQPSTFRCVYERSAIQLGNYK
ncbi:decorin isoform X3 [Emys orbicularis]|uniref:decorin isoform X3 n=1 Tax=Emys orbicularis TaxID=82168 RepID=UPI0031FCBA9C